jgi:ribosomal protein S17E
MAVRTPKDKKTLGPMSIDEQYWAELLEKMDNLKRLYRLAQRSETKKLKQEITNSITHLIGHLKVINEDGR